MKHFSRAHSRLAHLPLGARAIYSIFIGFTHAGLALSAWLAEEMTGLDLASLGAYYARKPALPGDAPGRSPASGPRIELPPELSAPTPAEPMPLRKLLEVTHFHLFSMPVYLMILSHLFMLSGVGLRAKITWLSLASFSVALHIAAPWLARTGHSASAFVYGGSGALLTVSFLVLGGVPLIEMWKPRSKTTPNDTAASDD